MILILSNQNDFTTNLVQDWLCYYEKNSIRVNNNLKNISFGLEGVKFVPENGHDPEGMNLKQVSACWFRKGQILGPHSGNDPITANERSVTKGYVSHLLRDKKSIGDFINENTVNKLIVLEQAKVSGLHIPETYIVETKKDIQTLLKKNDDKEFIVKMKTDTSMFQFDDCAAIIYTNVLKIDELGELPDVFAPTLIQEKINKVFEIRTFYLDGKTWSMAIFSQQDEKTKDDYRRYNNQKPNRNTPFKIPAHLERALCKLMETLDLRTGSIDWILAEDNNYYFLEVNPTGQFSNLSMTCNYPLEKIMAEKL
ncbi:grasp-with-spasm system ATP-grasp peptide maturase [Chryseobacterium sp. ISL-6]|uniref:grasp-with-spasm system ATP-grasp peptide maturase n=1 Tax=Chryseobacterium sp. ISL-6 TaxID=2819143 RepID=UPI001BEA3A4C|nr:grasp-with-spasm system ATP-grasp peptide maturase [Chryseobacterium sp. ISL-6]MBT2416214.1 grasp-with-spasm system ATP-grasp peptide maturase [Streptomyces sp. ISL-12]MBT2621288.1 grasp-with-spasm system ATP-grasp peptide maturase [Chryseobacterium sp. ISL-6]